MAREYPLVVVFEELEMVVGEFDEETNSYHMHADGNHVSHWFEAITACLGAIVTPAFASTVVGVSRPAVHHKIKTGGLTSFHFHPSSRDEGNSDEAREAPYVFVTMRECRGWGKQIENRLLRLNHLQPEDIGSGKPDWYFEFYDWLHSGNFADIQDRLADEEREHLESYKEFCHMQYNR